MLLVIGWVTLRPQRVDESAGASLLAVLGRLQARGLPTWVDYAFVESTANVVMFLPYGALLAALLPARLWWLAVALPASTSVLVETVQHLLLPQRFASGWDVVANTAGAAVGVVLMRLVAARRRHRVRMPGFRSGRGLPMG